jgi:hypothetical protein
MLKFGLLIWPATAKHQRFHSTLRKLWRHEWHWQKLSHASSGFFLGAL